MGVGLDDGADVGGQSRVLLFAASSAACGRGSRAGRRRTSTGAAHRTRVLRVHLCEPADDIVEASVVLVDGGRVRALALRLAGRDHRWVVQALQVG